MRQRAIGVRFSDLQPACPALPASDPTMLEACSSGVARIWSDPHGIHRGPPVDGYIDALPDWQQAICREVRDLVHAVDPEVTETVKRTDRPYFVLGGNICALLAAKAHVNIFLYDGAIVPDPEPII